MIVELPAENKKLLLDACGAKLVSLTSRKLRSDAISEPLKNIVAFYLRDDVSRM